MRVSDSHYGPPPSPVMAWLVPAIPATAVPADSCALLTSGAGGDGRDKPGHDDEGTHARQNENRCMRVTKAVAN